MPKLANLLVFAAVYGPDLISAKRKPENIGNVAFEVSERHFSIHTTAAMVYLFVFLVSVCLRFFSVQIAGRHGL